MKTFVSPRSVFTAFQFVLDVSVSLSRNKHSFYGLPFFLVSRHANVGLE